MSWLLLNGPDGVTLGYQRNHQVIDPSQPLPPLAGDLSAKRADLVAGRPSSTGPTRKAFSFWPVAVAGVAAARLRRVRETSLDRVGRR